MLRAFCFVLALALIPACESGARPPYTIGIVTASGDDPIGTISSGTVTIRVRQLDMPILSPDPTPRISGGELEPVDVTIPSYGIITRIQVEIEDAMSGTSEPEFIGASPAFLPVGFGVVRLVVGAPGTCATLSSPVLSSARIGPNLVAMESNLIAIGGDEPTVTVGELRPSTRAELFFPTQLTIADAHEDLAQLEVGISAGGALRLGSTTQLVALSDIRRAVLYFPGEERDVDLELAQTEPNFVHLGAGRSSALADLGEDGVAIVGGISGDDPSDEITWVSLTARTSGSRMSTPRVRPAAVRIGNHLLVAGGQAADQPLFEIISIADPSAPISFGPREQRFAPVLVRDPGSSRAWLGFGEDADGALWDTTLRIDGCPSTCVASAAASIDRPRRGMRVVERDGETVILGGADAAGPSDAVDRVRFVAGAPVVEPLGSLASARDRPGAAEIGGGMIIVGGGSGGSPERALSDMEICFPEELEEL